MIKNRHRIRTAATIGLIGLTGLTGRAHANIPREMPAGRIAGTKHQINYKLGEKEIQRIERVKGAIMRELKPQEIQKAREIFSRIKSIYTEGTRIMMPKEIGVGLEKQILEQINAGGLKKLEINLQKIESRLKEINSSKELRAKFDALEKKYYKELIGKNMDEKMARYVAKTLTFEEMQ